MSNRHKSNRYNNYNLMKEAPETLKDHIFYGMKLDEQQIEFRDAIWDYDTRIVICNARAGTGKTTVALATANLMVQYGRYSGIIYIASPTQEQKQGYLPGRLEEKSAPYMDPLITAMNTLDIPPISLISDDNIAGMKTGDAYIQFIVHTYLRGCNFEDKIIIIDEAENFYFDELKKVLTRIHDNCKCIMIGHDGQCDLYKHPEKSGFVSYINAFKEIEDDPRVAICELNINHRGWLSTFCDSVEMI